MKNHFRTELVSLNVKFKVTFSNKGLLAGIMRRVDKNGKSYFTEDGRKFKVYQKAVDHQVVIDNKPRKRWSNA